ncbi:MAG TPA: metallophosphoesterase [Terriglobia bacterium]|nr:metallophosphoesterase [Terriglobia bacterium]
MATSSIGLQLDRALELRLARRRAVETAFRKGSPRSAHRDSLALRERFLSVTLRAALKLTGLYSRGMRNALEPVVREVRFELEGVPASFEGFRILHLADLHIDGMEGLAEVIVERLAGLDADVCVMTGDYRFAVGGPCEQVYSRMWKILRGLRPPHGVFAILGNHDESEIAVELQGFGVRMLINEAVKINQGGEGLWVVGVDDPHRYGCDDLEGALERVPPGAFKLLLAHSPELFSEAAHADVDFYLCGHTHAGQICLPRIGPPLMNADCPRSYTSGRWRHGEMHGYTSAGLGCSLVPVRYNCPPEITVIELARKPDSAPIMAPTLSGSF